MPDTRPCASMDYFILSPKQSRGMKIEGNISKFLMVTQYGMELVFKSRQFKSSSV